MDAKEICEKYCDNELIADIAEEMEKLFSLPIDKGLSQEYDLEEMATELLAFYQNERGLPKLEELLGMLEKYNPSIYKEVFQLFAIDLINHYCYKNERSKAQNAFSGFLKYPNSDVDLFFMGLEIIGYYGFNEFVEYACNQTVEAIKKHEGEDSYSAPEMMKFIYPIVTEQLYKEHPQSSDFSLIDKELARFSDVDGKISEGNFFLEAVFTEESQLELLKSLFLKEREKALKMIDGKFVRYMLGKGMNFYTSMSIWAKMTGYWDENSHSRKELKPDFYFRLSKKSYQEYIQKYNKRGVLDSNYEGAVIAWGSFYIYEFLYQELGLISKKLFDTFWEIAPLVKGNYIGENYFILFQLSFLRRWEKPKGEDEKVHFHEGKIFEKSFDAFNDDGVRFAEFKEKIKENLAEMGEVASAIVKGGEAGDVQMEEMKELFEKFVSTTGEHDSLEEDYFDEEEEVEDIDYEEMPPYFKEPQNPKPKVSEKVGRNEPCPCGSGKKYKKCCGK